MGRRAPAAPAAAAALALLAACGGGGDGGGGAARVETIPFPGSAGSAQPRLVSDTRGAPVLSWLAPEDDAHVLRYARYRDGSFGGIREVARSERMFVNQADFPSVTPITEDLWFAHWLRLQPDSFAYDIATAVSTNGGLSWSEAEQMNEDETETEHGFVSVFPWNEEIAAFWLDGRELADWSFENPEALLGVSLRLARYADDGSVSEREVTDELVCDCCQPDVAVTAEGPLVIYRDRTEDDIRDVVVRRRVGGGWSEPLQLGNEGWYIAGCPINGPVAAAAGSEVVAAWFTAAEGRSRVRFARSRDAGASFSAPVDVDTEGALGRPAIVLDDDGRALVSWWRRGERGGIDLMLTAFDRDNRAVARLHIAHETVGQPVDVPQLIAAGDAYLAAWTTSNGEGTVRLAALDLPR